MLAGSDFSQFFDWKLALVSDGVFTYVVLTPTPRMFLIRHFGDQDRPMQGNDESERKMEVCKESTKRSGFPESQQNFGEHLKYMEGKHPAKVFFKSQQNFGDLLEVHAGQSETNVQRKNKKRWLEPQQEVRRAAHMRRA